LYGNGFSPSVSNPPTAILVQLPWTRASDSLLSANDSAPPTEYSAILLITLASLEGGDVRLSGVEAGTDGQTRAARPTALSVSELPYYLHDAPPVVTVVVTAPPSDAPLAARLVLPPSDEGLPAYLIGSEEAARAATNVAGDSATESTSPDAGLAAVDAAFGLLAQEGSLASGPLPAASRDEQPLPSRRIGWPMWLVLLAAASGGGAVYACPVVRRRGGSSRHRCETCEASVTPS